MNGCVSMGTSNQAGGYWKLLMLIILMAGNLQRVGLFSGTLSMAVFFSFTNLSNWLLIVITAISLKLQLEGKQLTQQLWRLRVMGLFAIVVTGVVYHVWLLPQKIAENPAYEAVTFPNLVVHYIAPLAMTIDWYCFDRKGCLTVRDPFKWLLVPVGYFVSAMVYGRLMPNLTGKQTAYPYFFLDVDTLGIMGVAKWAALFSGLFFLLAYGFYRLDRYLGKQQLDARCYEKRNLDTGV